MSSWGAVWEQEVGVGVLAKPGGGVRSISIANGTILRLIS